MIITQGNPAKILLTATRNGALIDDWTDADSITVNVGTVFDDYAITKTEAQLTIESGSLYLELTDAETLALAVGAYGVLISAEWTATNLEVWNQTVFEIRELASIGVQSVSTLETSDRYMYPTLAWAAEYFRTERLETSPWDDATDLQRLKALSQSTEILDRLNYLDEKAEANQPLQFPRKELGLPLDILKACCEIALALLDGVDPELEYENLFMLSQGYSTVRSSYDREHKQSNILSGVPSVTAWRYLAPYLEDYREINLYRVS